MYKVSFLKYKFLLQFMIVFMCFFVGMSIYFIYVALDIWNCPRFFILFNWLFVSKSDWCCNWKDDLEILKWILIQILEIMARQKGIIKLKGTIGDITFTPRRTFGAWKGGIDASRIKVILRSKERVKMVRRAGKAGKILRTAWELCWNFCRRLKVSRLTQNGSLSKLDLISVEVYEMWLMAKPNF
jgi:hypothetical protein